MSVLARDIRARLGRREVLEGASLAAEPGEVTCIVGPNGSGKSTLLRCLSGDLAYRGRIALNGRDLSDYRPRDMAAIRAVLEQALSVAFPFTVAEVVALGLGAGLAAGEAGQVAAALARVGLQGHAARPFGELSGGEQQRAHLARVIAQVPEPCRDGAPRWLFLDEPVSSLDIGHQLMVMALARDHAARGGGVIAVMHDLNLTAMFADRVAVMRAGRVLAMGTPAETLTAPVLEAAYGCALRPGLVPAGVFVLPQSAGPLQRAFT